MDRISISIAYRLRLILSLNCFGLSKMAAVFSLQVVLVAMLLFLWYIFDFLSFGLIIQQGPMVFLHI